MVRSYCSTTNTFISYECDQCTLFTSRYTVTSAHHALCLESDRVQHGNRAYNTPPTFVLTCEMNSIRASSATNFWISGSCMLHPSHRYIPGSERIHESELPQMIVALASSSWLASRLSIAPSTFSISDVVRFISDNYLRHSLPCESSGPVLKYFPCAPTVCDAL